MTAGDLESSGNGTAHTHERDAVLVVQHVHVLFSLCVGGPKRWCSKIRADVDG